MEIRSVLQTGVATLALLGLAGCGGSPQPPKDPIKAPVIEKINTPGQNPITGHPETYTVQVTDPEKGTLTFDTPVSSDPKVATVRGDGPKIYLKPLAQGHVTITGTVTSSSGGWAQYQFDVTVVANHLPYLRQPNIAISALTNCKNHLLLQDDDGDSVKCTGDASNPSWATVDTSDSSLVTTPGLKDIGSHEIKLVLDDCYGGLATVTLPVTVLPPANGPMLWNLELPRQDTLAYPEKWTRTVKASDPEETRVTYAAQIDPPSAGEAVIDPDTGVVSFTPSRDGSATLTVTATDEGKDVPITTSTQLTIEANTAPRIAPVTQGDRVNELWFEVPSQGSRTFTWDLTATDAEHDTFTWSLDSSKPGWASLDPVSGRLTLTPTRADLGTHALEIRCTDAHGCIGTLSLTVKLM